MGVFPALGYGGVWAKLTAALDGLPLSFPSAKGLRELRRRLGPAPFRALFEVLAGPSAQPATPGIRFGRYRTVAFDGCTSIKVPDTARNRSWLGKMNAALGVTGHPAVELMTLVRPGGNQFRFLTRRMGGLRAALADLPRFPKQPVHRGDRGQVDALIDQQGPGLARGLVPEPGTIQDREQLAALGGRQRVRRGRPPLPAPRPGASAPAVNRRT